MFLLSPTPRRTATSPGLRTHLVELCGQTAECQVWFMKPIRRFDGGVPLGEIRDMAMQHGLWLCWQPVLNR